MEAAPPLAVAFAAVQEATKRPMNQKRFNCISASFGDQILGACSFPEQLPSERTDTANACVHLFEGRGLRADGTSQESSCSGSYGR